MCTMKAQDQVFHFDFLDVRNGIVTSENRRHVKLAIIDGAAIPWAYLGQLRRSLRHSFAHCRQKAACLQGI